MLARTVAALALVSGFLQPTSLLAQQPEPSTPLFNGQNFAGWYTSNLKGDSYEIAGNVLRLRNASGWLLTTESYYAFTLRFEARALTATSEGGVLFHALLSSGSPDFAYEVRVADRAGRAAALRQHAHAIVTMLNEGPTVKFSKEWRRYVIDVRGPSVVVLVDLQPALNIRDLRDETGRIGFHSDSGVIEFRDIELQRLSPEPPSRPAPIPAEAGAWVTTPPVAKPGDPGVTMPQVEREVKPKYSPEAMQAGVQGVVWLECVVLPDGTVGDVIVTRSLRPDLDANAIAAAKRWRFRPGTRNGEPVAVLVSISMSFTLRK